jgi:hypothetical protein
MLTRKQYSNTVATRLRVESGNANQEIQPMEKNTADFRVIAMCELLY